MTLQHVALKILRKGYRIAMGTNDNFMDTSGVEYVGQQANDYVRDRILQADSGLMISKFGTIELGAVCCSKVQREGLTLRDAIRYIQGRLELDPNETVKWLHSNAGFFPETVDAQEQFTNRVLEDVKQIDILGSYIDKEIHLERELEHCKKIDIDGYCSPFFWENPWTGALKGKKVLVVHPFTESICRQYEKRQRLFADPNVLPEFGDLVTVKAVQSIAGNEKSTGYDSWFDALSAMESQVDQKDYDVALIGCGAYGMSLAAHCRRKGKIAIHMASWVQMLFGIYGQRWLVDQPEYKRWINEYWVRPLESERPQNAQIVENGAYW